MSVEPQHAMVQAGVDQVAAHIRDACDQCGIDLHDTAIKTAILALCRFTMLSMEQQPAYFQAYAASMCMAAWAQAIPV